MANEGLVWDPLLKMSHDPGGDWHPGKGDNPTYTIICHVCQVGKEVEVFLAFGGEKPSKKIP